MHQHRASPGAAASCLRERGGASSCLCVSQSNETADQALQTKLKQLARQALDRYVLRSADAAAASPLA